MSASDKHARFRFFGLPGLGGKLAILNCLAWLCLLALMKTERVPDWIFLVPALILSLPIALPCMLPSLHPPSGPEIIAACVMVGINSFLWGYGIAWLKQLRQAPRT